jgi:hypothetical protein
MKNNKNESIMTIKVKEALPKDVGRAIVRIDLEDMKALPNPLPLVCLPPTAGRG